MKLPEKIGDTFGRFDGWLTCSVFRRIERMRDAYIKAFVRYLKEH